MIKENKSKSSFNIIKWGHEFVRPSNIYDVSHPEKTKKIISNVVNKMNKDWFIMSVKANFGRDPMMYHQCVFILNKPTKNVIFFDPYGKPKMFGLSYENCVKKIAKDIFPEYTYKSSNIAQSYQTLLLKYNNKFATSGQFDKEMNIMLSGKCGCLSKQKFDAIMKESYDDEKDKTVATLNLIHDLGQIRNKLCPQCMKKAFSLFYLRSSKICVSITLVILYYFTEHSAIYDKFNGTNILDDLKIFLTPQILKYIKNFSIDEKDVCRLIS
jgi:hypothetical protein